jgi:ABC-type proline/glycine betaine transport system permease subunit
MNFDITDIKTKLGAFIADSTDDPLGLILIVGSLSVVVLSLLLKASFSNMKKADAKKKEFCSNDIDI